MAGTAPVMIRGSIATPIGVMLVVYDDDAVRAIDWEDHEPRMRRLLRRHCGGSSVELVDGELPRPVRRTVERYFAGELDALRELPVMTRGTAFQEQVWAALKTIPPGETRSYGSLAVAIGHPRAVRAVGLANGANPIGVAVPCHRVIGSAGGLTGYGGGLARKRWLLAHEGVTGLAKEDWT